MKVRIGNDIRLKLQLTFGGTTDRANIQMARAFFINTTLKEKLEQEYIKKNRFIGRFPIEPFVNEFEPTAYNINSTGFPKYAAMVHNPYKGFGVNPNWKDVFPFKDVNITKFEANIVHTQDPTIIKVDFPAAAQLYEGKYELIIVAQIYDEGYNNNIRTVTANYKNIFELVKDSQEADVENPVQIELNNESQPAEELQDIYVVSGNYNDEAITLRRTDGGMVNVDVSPIAGWYTEPEE